MLYTIISLLFLTRELLDYTEAFDLLRLSFAFYFAPYIYKGFIAGLQGITYCNPEWVSNVEDFNEK